MANNITTINFDNNEYSLRPYGICSTVAAIEAKTVDITGFTLFTGATILVKFTYTNTAVDPTLNINSTGAKSIKHGNEDVSLIAGVIYEFIYDGANWEMVGLADTKVKQTYTGSTNEFPLLLSPNNHTSGKAGVAYYDTGVTLNPSTDTLTTKIKLKTSAGMWKSGRNQAAIDYKLSAAAGIGTTSYHSILGVKSGSGNVVNIGGLADDFGFYGWNKAAVDDTTSENVIPTWSFKFNTSTGDITASGNVVATSFKEGTTLLSDKYVLKDNMTDATTAEIEALFN